MPTPKVSVFNYFDFPETGGRAAHNQVETEIWKPIHDQRVKDGEMMGWVLLNKIMPFGRSESYKSATVDLYDSIEDYLTLGSPIPTMEKIHAGKDIDQLLEQTAAAAHLTKGEVRILLEHSSQE